MRNFKQILDYFYWIFLAFIHFSRRNCPIAKRRLTTVAGARPDWGGQRPRLGGGAIAPPLPHAGYGPGGVYFNYICISGDCTVLLSIITNSHINCCQVVYAGFVVCSFCFIELKKATEVVYVSFIFYSLSCMYEYNTRYITK